MIIQSFQKKDGLARKIAKPIMAATLFVVMTAAITAGTASKAEACGSIHFQAGMHGIQKVVTMNGTNSMGTPLNGSLGLDSNDVSGTIVKNIDPFSSGNGYNGHNNIVSSTDDLNNTVLTNSVSVDGVVVSSGGFGR